MHSRNKKSCFLLFCVALCVSCGKQNTTVPVDKPLDGNTKFADFLSAIPKGDLPIHLICTLPNGTKFKGDFEIYESFFPASMDRVFGVIDNPSGEYKLVLFGKTGDDIYPYLVSFSNDGVVKDSVSLILSGCGGADDQQIPVSFVSIEKDLVIHLRDTIRFIHYPKSSDVYVVDSMHVSSELVKIENDGTFHLIK